MYPHRRSRLISSADFFQKGQKQTWYSMVCLQRKTNRYHAHLRPYLFEVMAQIAPKCPILLGYPNGRSHSNDAGSSECPTYLVVESREVFPPILPKILPYTQPLYNPYIGDTCWYISRVLSQGYPTFPFDKTDPPPKKGSTSNPTSPPFFSERSLVFWDAYFLSPQQKSLGDETSGVAGRNINGRK